MVKINHWSQLGNNTLYIHSIFISCKKYTLKSGNGNLKGAFWRVLFEGQFMMQTNTWRVDTTPAIWFFTMETNTFWSCFQYLHVDFWTILMQKLRIIFQIVWGLTISFRGFITSKLTRIFVNFRVIHVLTSLPILFYWITLDQISHTSFEWNLVNGCTAWNCHPNCLYVCS